MQIDWVGDLPAQGVGGRQARGSADPGGGGYLHECTGLEVWEAAKIRELVHMGLPAIWIAVAREIGYEPFMAMWRLLDAAVELRSESESMIEVQLRRFSSFRRYQRNRYIETLAGLGLTPGEIRERVKTELGEELSSSHMFRLSSRRRVKA